MRGSFRFAGAVLAVFFMFLGHSADAYAAERITWDNFDYIAYADTYPDLFQAFGYDKQTLYNHYVTCGISEGRIAHAVVIRPSQLSLFKRGNDESYYFDSSRYAAEYPDLAAAFGNNKMALWNHYKTCGISEGRRAYGTTDAVNARLKVFDVAYSITNGSMTEREKIQAVHDWIVNNTSYDYQNYLNDTIPGISYEIEGVMLRGVGVCSGYAKTFDYFMYILGIEREYVTGVASGGDGSGGHAWNRVFVDGSWLYVDCTWDDPVCIGGGNVLRYDYFLISLEDISHDHIQQCAYTL